MVLLRRARLSASPNGDPKRDALHPLKPVLEDGGGRSAGGSNGEQRAFNEELERDRAPGVGEMPGAKNLRRVRIGAELARLARGAVLRCLEVTEQVVVLERRGHQEDGIDRQPGKRQAPRVKIFPSTWHHFDDTPLKQHEQPNAVRVTKPRLKPPRADPPAGSESS